MTPIFTWSRPRLVLFAVVVAVAVFIYLMNPTKQPTRVACLKCNMPLVSRTNRHDTPYRWTTGELHTATNIITDHVWASQWICVFHATCWSNSTILQRLDLYRQFMVNAKWPDDEQILVLKSTLEGQ